MAVRDRYARIAPLLPYAPEPNLFLDAKAVSSSGKTQSRIEFGSKGGEFQELGNTLNAFAARELESFYAQDIRRKRRRVERRAEEIVERETQGQSEEDAKDLELEIFEARDRVLAGLEVETRALLDTQGQNNQHPERGTVFYTDFQGLAIETDLSRLAYGFGERNDTTAGDGGGNIPQSHLALTNVVNRLFQQGPSKRGTRIGTMTEGNKPSADWLAFFRDLYTDLGRVDGFEHDEAECE